MNGITVFPRLVAGCDYLREGDYSREVIISNIAHWKLCLKYLFYFPIKSKNNQSNKLNMGFLILPNLVLLSQLKSSLINYAGSHCTLT